MDEDVSTSKLSAIYLKIRDARSALKAQYEEEDKQLEAQMDVIEAKLLDICRTTDADSIKTQAGTVIRRVAIRYWTNDWDSMYEFVKANDALGLFEKRISQTNMKQFLEENPDKFPKGMLLDSAYKITVRRSNK
jgi:hypothetical protein